MGKRTKVVGIAGRYGPRYGSTLRKRVKAVLEQRYAPHICPFCGAKGKVVRISTGIWMCKKCGTIYFPPQLDCPKCRSSDMEWIELSGEGELLTFTQINVKPYSFSHYPDYIVGIARLKEGINVTAWVAESDPKKLKPGVKVKLQVTKRQPENYLTYEIVPIE